MQRVSGAKVTVPKVSVYIPSHNYGRFLGAAIESVLRQSFDDWELLLIDDGSTDDTASVMQIYSGDPRIRCFRTEGIGLSSVCNLALREAKGQFIIRLDGDDRFDENILVILTNFLERNPEITLVFPDYYLIDEVGNLLDSIRREPIYDSNHMLDTPPNGACFLARRSTLVHIGGYSNEIQAQDGLYIWNKVLKSHRAANINLPLYYYRRHSANLTNTPQRITEARQQTKRALVGKELEQGKPHILVIPCRQNYDFASDVWRLTFNGRSLLDNAVKTALASDLFQQVVVACDNEEVKFTLRKHRDSRLHFILRERRETIRSSNLATTLLRIAQKYDPKLLGTTTTLYVQTPFLSTATLEESLLTMITSDADSAIGVEEITRPVLIRSAFGLSPLTETLNVKREFSSIFLDSCSISSTWNYNLKSGAHTGAHVASFLISSEQSFFVDSEKKLAVAAALEAEEKSSLALTTSPKLAITK